MRIPSLVAVALLVSCAADKPDELVLTVPENPVPAEPVAPAPPVAPQPPPPAPPAPPMVAADLRCGPDDDGCAMERIQAFFGKTEFLLLTGISTVNEAKALHAEFFVDAAQRQAYAELDPAKLLTCWAWSEGAATQSAYLDEFTVASAGAYMTMSEHGHVVIHLEAVPAMKSAMCGLRLPSLAEPNSNLKLLGDVKIVQPPNRYRPPCAQARREQCRPVAPR